MMPFDGDDFFISAIKPNPFFSANSSLFIKPLGFSSSFEETLKSLTEYFFLSSKISFFLNSTILSKILDI